MTPMYGTEIVSVKQVKLAGSYERNDQLSVLHWGPKVVEWRPRTGKRSVGRPPARWTDNIKRVAGSRWMQAAQDCTHKGHSPIANSTEASNELADLIEAEEIVYCRLHSVAEM